MWMAPLCRHLYLTPPPLRRQAIKEAMAEAVGLSTSREVWTALENTFSHHSKAHEIPLKDDLQLMKCGTHPVIAYARAFKALCD